MISTLKSFKLAILLNSFRVQNCGRLRVCDPVRPNTANMLNAGPAEMSWCRSALGLKCLDPDYDDLSLGSDAYKRFISDENHLTGQQCTATVVAEILFHRRPHALPVQRGNVPDNAVVLCVTAAGDGKGIGWGRGSDFRERKQTTTNRVRNTLHAYCNR